MRESSFWFSSFIICGQFIPNALRASACEMAATPPIPLEEMSRPLASMRGVAGLAWRVFLTALSALAWRLAECGCDCGVGAGDAGCGCGIGSLDIAMSVATNRASADAVGSSAASRPSASAAASSLSL